jgi:serine/threonine-protein kinase
MPSDLHHPSGSSSGSSSGPVSGSISGASSDSFDGSPPEAHFDQPRLPVEELKTRLWALSYEKKQNLVCCENCGTTTNITRLVANPNAIPERRPSDASEQKPEGSPEDDTEDSSTKSTIQRCIDNRYDIIRPLGEGGMGSVFLVHDRVLDKHMAIKMLRDDVSQADGILAKRFEQEARSALEMTHVNVVAAYGQGRDTSGAPYLVMDYIEGVSLSELIQSQGVMEIHYALDIFMQVCEALTHAHTKNLIHRDIKPANVLLRPIEGGGAMVKLVDFGIAKTLPLFDHETRALTQTGEILGSPAYMSPEHCLGEEADERSDIYSLGCVMYEALTGQPPFTAKHPIKAILQHLRAAADPLARRVKIEDQPTMGADFDYFQYRKAVESVVMRCLEKEPLDRYQSADALRLDLEQLSKDLIPREPGRKLPEQGRKPIEQRRKLTEQDCMSAENSSNLIEQDRQPEEKGRAEAAVALIVLTLVLIAMWIARAF